MVLGSGKILNYFSQGIKAARQTFYGADEFGYQEPGGHFITFAEFKEG